MQLAEFSQFSLANNQHFDWIPSTNYSHYAMATANPKANPQLLENDQQAPATFVSDSIAIGLAFALVLTISQRAIGFGRGLLFCRLMTDQQLGQWSMAWSYLMLLVPFAVLGLPGCFGKFTEHYQQRGQLRTFLIRVAAISCCTTLVISILIFLFPRLTSQLLFRDPSQISLARYLGIAIIAVSAFNFVGALLESLRQVRVVTISRFVSGISFAVIGALLLLLWENKASAATFAFTIACLVGMLPAIWILWKNRAGFRSDGESLKHSTMWKRIAPYAAWMWATNLLSNLIEVSDRYMLLQWSSSSPEIAQASVGQYHSGRVVPLVLVSIAAMLGGVLIPYLSQAWESNNKAKAQKQLNWSFKLISVSFTAAGIGILIAAPLLFDWVLQGRYNDGLAILPLTLVYCIWFGLMTVAQDYLWVAEKGKWATIVSGIGLLVNIVVNLILIPKIGLPGAVIGTACGNGVLVALMVLMNHRFGCRMNTGIWICSLLPLILLTKPLVATGLLITIGIVCFFSNLILNNEEKQDLQKVYLLALDRLTKRDKA